MTTVNTVPVFSSVLGFYDKHLGNLAHDVSHFIGTYLPIDDILFDFPKPSNSAAKTPPLTTGHQHQHHHHHHHHNHQSTTKMQLNNAAAATLSADHYNYTWKLPFEDSFNSREAVDSMRNYDWRSSIVYALIYLLLVLLGRIWMRSRPRYELRMPLVLWNLALATFSFVGMVRVLPEFLYAIGERGIVYSVCNNSYAYGVSGFWAYLFCFSKLPELVDTMFIVLRKQELIFLHWYHHATVLIYCWYSYHNFTASGRWFMIMNYMVHTLMYAYYSLKAMRFHVPKQFALLITSGQLAQMFVGCYVNYVAWQTKMHEPETACDVTSDNIKWSFIMYFSYFVLFLHFFLNAYVFKGGKKSLSGSSTKTTTPATTPIGSFADLNNNNSSTGSPAAETRRARKEK